jgi:hypothetical protein
MGECQSSPGIFPGKGVRIVLDAAQRTESKRPIPDFDFRGLAALRCYNRHSFPILHNG